MAGEKKMPAPEEITKVCQAHINKLIPLITKVETEIITNANISAEQLIQYFDQQVKLEGLVNWIIALEKRFNPSKVVSLNRSPIIQG